MNNVNNEEASQSCYEQGRAALEHGDIVNALAQLTKAVAMNENNAEARLLRGQLLMRMGDKKGASEDAKWLLEHHPELMSDMNGEFKMGKM